MKNITYVALLAVLVLLVVSRSAFVVDQAEQAIIVQLGEPVGDVIAEPGLHWRVGDGWWLSGADSRTGTELGNRSSRCQESAARLQGARWFAARSQALLRQAPKTRPLIAMPSRGRPMSMQIRGQGFVSNAENTEMVAYSINIKANQHASATFRPHQTLVGLVRAMSTASV